MRLDPGALAKLHEISAVRETLARAALSAVLAEERELAEELATLARTKGRDVDFSAGSSGELWWLWLARRREALLGRLALVRARREEARCAFGHAFAKAQAVQRLLEKSNFEERCERTSRRQESLLHEAMVMRQAEEGYSS